MLFICKLLTGLSGSIFTITTPVVSSGKFRCCISSFVIGLTSIFKPSIFVVFKTFGVGSLKSSEVSNLPKVIFL